MHELSIALEIHRVSRAALERSGARGRLEVVRVAVGERSGIEPELLAFAWEAVVKGGPDEGSRLDVEWRLATQSCPNCGPVVDRQPGDWLRLCPTCGDPLRVEGGDELDLTGVTATDDPEPPAP